MPIDAASPTSCIESDKIATEFVTRPPKNSKTAKDRLSINAIKMFL